uniref:Uncharacterized protein n=1 Tax=Timema shepardi TaxID=629360 RepID=A0A7R9AQD7_TIMSH|nr:unnamed protein product [Timema shepardi]
MSHGGTRGTPKVGNSRGLVLTDSFKQVTHPGWIATLRLAHDLGATILSIVTDGSENMDCGAVQAVEGDWRGLCIWGEKIQGPTEQ